ncbi:MAG: PilZ domain-containing protein [Candidatus Bathyarchaeia archaeon]
MKSGVELRNSVRCNTKILSRWCRKGEQFETPIGSISWVAFEPSQTYHARRTFRSEEFHELERRISRVEEKLNTLFGMLVKQQAHGLLEGPFLGDVSGLGIRFGTRKTPPNIKERIEIEVLLEGTSIISFKSELEVLRVEPSSDGVCFIAGRFTKIDPEVQEQIVRFVFQCQREEIRASRGEV